MKNRSFLQVFLVCLIGLFLVACGSEKEDDTQTVNGTTGAAGNNLNLSCEQYSGYVTDPSTGSCVYVGSAATSGQDPTYSYGSQDGYRILCDYYTGQCYYY